MIIRHLLHSMVKRVVLFHVITKTANQEFKKTVAKRHAVNELRCKIILWIQSSSVVKSRLFASLRAADVRNNHARFSYTTKVTQVPGRTRTRFAPIPR